MAEIHSARLGEFMYGKVLLTTDAATIPLLIVSLHPAREDRHTLLEQLQSYGWARYGTYVEPIGKVVLNDKVARVLSGSETIFQAFSEDSWSPIGWWEAVSNLGDRCMVLVAEPGVIELKARDVANQVEALLGSPQAVCAVLPVVH